MIDVHSSQNQCPQFSFKRAAKHCPKTIMPINTNSTLNQRLIVELNNIQQLLMTAIFSKDYLPILHWCKLRKGCNISQVCLLILDGVTTDLCQIFIDAKIPDVFQFGNYVDVIDNDTTKLVDSDNHLSKADVVLSRLLSVPICHLSKTIKYQNLSESNSSNNLPSASSRLELLLSPLQMCKEGYPMPGDLATVSYIPTKSEYSIVGNSSPIFSVDCEMVLTDNYVHELARITVINEQSEVIYDEIVKPDHSVVDYLTWVSGITKEMLDSTCKTLKSVQQNLITLLPPDAILCGHSLNNDLHAMQMLHPYVIDTSVIYNVRGVRGIKPALRLLSSVFLGRDIQTGCQGHLPYEDALATLHLVKLKLAKGICFGDVASGKWNSDDYTIFLNNRSTYLHSINIFDESDKLLTDYKIPVDNDNRYLFLQTLTNARRVVYISNSIYNNSMPFYEVVKHERVDASFTNFMRTIGNVCASQQYDMILSSYAFKACSPSDEKLKKRIHRLFSKLPSNSLFIMMCINDFKHDTNVNNSVCDNSSILGQCYFDMKN